MTTQQAPSPATRPTRSAASSTRCAQEVVADLGQRDVDHIRARRSALARYSEAAGRAAAHFGLDPRQLRRSASARSPLAKILENMEIGHNVMHGQYDWTRDPTLDSHAYEWDIVCAGDDWRHSHNYEHHTFTNILGQGSRHRLRVPARLPRAALAPGAPRAAARRRSCSRSRSSGASALHDLRVDEPLDRQAVARRTLRARARPFLRKAGWQLGKDYVVLSRARAVERAARLRRQSPGQRRAQPVDVRRSSSAATSPTACSVFARTRRAARAAASGTCASSTARRTSRAARWLHVLTGHLSHQIEHHLFPDLPAARYPEMAPRVREICARYGQPYNTGSFAPAARQRRAAACCACRCRRRHLQTRMGNSTRTAQRRQQRRTPGC